MGPRDMTEAMTAPAITPRGLELGGSAPADFDPVAMARQVLRTARTAALATLDPQSGFPLATLTNIATDADGSPLFLASRLSLHTRNIEADARLSLLVSSLGKGDPLAASARLSVVGRAQRCIDVNARRRFLARHPKAKLYADFPDFALYRVEVLGLHPNGGFARAGEIAPGEVLLDLSGCEALLATEGEALEHLNADHAEALALYATRLLGLPAGRWKASGLDPEGLDLVSGEEAGRLIFPERIREPSALRRVLVALADKARAQADS